MGPVRGCASPDLVTDLRAIKDRKDRHAVLSLQLLKLLARFMAAMPLTEPAIPRYAVTGPCCFAGERNQSTAATSSSAGTSPTR